MFIDFSKTFSKPGFLHATYAPTIMGIKEARMIQVSSDTKDLKIKYASRGPWLRTQILLPATRLRELHYRPLELYSLHTYRLMLNPSKLKDLEKLSHFVLKPESVAFYAALLSPLQEATVEDDDVIESTEIDIEDNSSRASDQE